MKALVLRDITSPDAGKSPLIVSDIPVPVPGSREVLQVPNR